MSISTPVTQKLYYALDAGNSLLRLTESAQFLSSFVRNPENRFYHADSYMSRDMRKLLWGFQPGATQMGLCSHRKVIES